VRADGEAVDAAAGDRGGRGGRENAMEDDRRLSVGPKRTHFGARRVAAAIKLVLAGWHPQIVLRSLSLCE
jgi:hypothetical protein